MCMLLYNVHFYSFTTNYVPSKTIIHNSTLLWFFFRENFISNFTDYVSSFVFDQPTFWGNWRHYFWRTPVDDAKTMIISILRKTIKKGPCRCQHQDYVHFILKNLPSLFLRSKIFHFQINHLIFFYNWKNFMFFLISFVKP